MGERVAWGALPAQPAAVLVVEVEGVDDATLADALPRIAAFADAHGLAVVAAIGVAQIDLAAAALLGANAVLLCAPTLAERVAALAAAAGSRMPGAVREGEGERLRRLNEEVARIAALLAGLVQDVPPTTVDDRRRGYRAERSDTQVDPALIRQAIRARRLRAQFVDARLIEDPGWDMLLDLFASELEGGQVSVSSLCIAAAVAPTTALRWITRLVAEGLFVRVPDVGDKRRAFLMLTRDASAAMRGYVGAARRAGLPVA